MSRSAAEAKVSLIKSTASFSVRGVDASCTQKSRQIQITGKTYITSMTSYIIALKGEDYRGPAVQIWRPKGF